VIDLPDPLLLSPSSSFFVLHKYINSNPMLLLISRILALARIIVSTLPPVNDNWKYYVEITESEGSGSKTVHEVTMDKEYYQEMSDEIILPEEFVKKSIEFLLKRENKDSILKEFNIRQISNYFTEYEDEIRKEIIK
jgi:hypothetical protein